MSPRRRSPRPLAGALELMRERWQPDTPVGHAQSAWAQIARVWAEVAGEHGSYVLERSEVVACNGGVLTVRCSEAVVSQTLELESAQVLARLNARLSGTPLTRLRCVTGALTGTPGH